MTKEKPTEPRLRFPGFTDAWKQRKLGEVAEINPKSVLPDKFKYVDLESVVGTEMISHRTEYKNSAPSRAQRVASKGDIFYQTVRPYQKNNYLFNLDSNDFVFSTGYAQLRPSCNGYFMFTVMQTEKFVNKVLDNCTGTSYPAINANKLAEIPIFLPPTVTPLTVGALPEQEAIGSFFSDLDQLITLHQRKLDSVKEMKKALLQKMFPKGNGNDFPELRFPGFTDAWKQRKLGEVAEMYSGGTPSVGRKDYYAGGIPFIRSAEINSDTTELYLTELGLNNSSAKMVSKGSLLYALYGATSGEVGLSRLDGAINQAILAILPDDDSTTEFLMYWLRKEKSTIVEKYLQGGQGNLSASIVKQLVLHLPTLPEQEAIGSFFSDLDQLITLHQRQLDHLKLLKKALLQQMFV
ncbi:TPA: restriction endonuclease subunit S [Streptococcus suis]